VIINIRVVQCADFGVKVLSVGTYHVQSATGED
jgi:hypothetical protein